MSRLWMALTAVAVLAVTTAGFAVNADAVLAAPDAQGGTTATIPSAATTSTSTVPPSAAGSCPSGQVKTNDGVCVSLPPGTSTLAFDDEFNLKSVNTSRWDVLYAHGDRSNNEPECFMPTNVSESAGSLHELLNVEGVTCPIDSINGGTGTLSSNYASGAIQMRKFNFTYGTVKVRAKFTGGTGPWPAAWLLGADCQQPNWLTTSTCNWPDSGSQEIDLAEILDGNLTSVNEETYLNGSRPDCRAPTTAVDQNWHIYTLIWSASELLFRIDGVTTCRFASAIPSTPMFMIINTAVGGVGGGQIKNNTLPQTTQVDWVRVFQSHR
jgi:beta-glucanase (GH16 family)